MDLSGLYLPQGPYDKYLKVAGYIKLVPGPLGAALGHIARRATVAAADHYINLFANYVANDSRVEPFEHRYELVVYGVPSALAALASKLGPVETS